MSFFMFSTKECHKKGHPFLLTLCIVHHANQSLFTTCGQVKIADHLVHRYFSLTYKIFTYETFFFLTVAIYHN